MEDKKKRTRKRKHNNTSKVNSTIPVIKINKIKKENTELEELKKKNKRVLNLIIILLIIIAIIVSLENYIKTKNELFETYLIEETTNLHKSYLIENKLANEVTCDSLKTISNRDEAFLLITDLYNKQEFNLEKDISNLIKEYNLKDRFYLYNNDNNCGILSSKESTIYTNLKLNKTIENIPTILYYKNGKLLDVIEREDKSMINKGDFQKVLDNYQIK